MDGGVQSALAGAGEISDEALDPQRLRQVIAQLQQKILKLTEQLRIEQTVRDENVAEYLKLANNSSDKQQSVRIKQVSPYFRRKGEARRLSRSNQQPESVSVSVNLCQLWPSAYPIHF